MEYLFIISIGLLGFFFITLLGRPGKKLPDWVFMSWIMLLLITEVSFLVYARGNANKHPLFITTICDTHLLHPFFLYVYIKAFTDEHYKLKPKIFLHLLPWVALIITKLYTNFGLKVMECYDEGSCLNVDNNYVTGFYIYKYLVMLIYIYLSYRLIKAHESHIKSAEDIFRNLWAKNLVKGTLFLFFGILLIQIFRVAFPVQLYDRMLITSTMATLFIFILLYMANSHASIFTSESSRYNTNKDHTIHTEITIITDEEKALFRKAEDYIISNKSYLNGMLTLKDLADELNCPQRLLSSCINMSTGHSFTHYINTYRVSYFKDLLDNPKKKQFTILSLAEESGFNSKSTLVRIFKQHTGTTPSEYLNRKE